MRLRIKYESHGVVESTATYARKQLLRAPGPGARTDCHQKEDLVYIQPGQERSVKERKRNRRRDRVFQMSSTGW